MIIFYCFIENYKYFQDYINSLATNIKDKKLLIKYTCPDKLLIYMKKNSETYFITNKHIFMQNISSNIYTWFNDSKIDIVSQNNIYIINTEQLTRDNFTIRYCKYQFTKYTFLYNINKYRINIIDYSLENIECFHKDKNLNNNISIYHIPYQINNSEILNYEKSKNIAMVGNNSSRRWYIYYKIRFNNIQINNIIGWGFKRDSKLFKYKILVNIHYDNKFHIMEQIRINRCIFNKIIVITEDSIYSNKLLLKKYMIICTYDNIMNMVMEVLKNYEQYYSQLFNDMNIQKLDKIFKKDFKIFT